jgi:hypothetical protein
MVGEGLIEGKDDGAADGGAANTFNSLISLPRNIIDSKT